jgi:hypothetical protein
MMELTIKSILHYIVQSHNAGISMYSIAEYLMERLESLGNDFLFCSKFVGEIEEALLELAGNNNITIEILRDVMNKAK